MVKVICKRCKKDTNEEGFECKRNICPYDQFIVVGTINLNSDLQLPRSKPNTGNHLPEDITTIPSAGS